MASAGGLAIRLRFGGLALGGAEPSSSRVQGCRGSGPGMVLGGERDMDLTIWPYRGDDGDIVLGIERDLEGVLVLRYVCQ